MPGSTVSTRHAEDGRERLRGTIGAREAQRPAFEASPSDLVLGNAFRMQVLRSKLDFLAGARARGRALAGVSR